MKHYLLIGSIIFAAAVTSWFQKIYQQENLSEILVLANRIFKKEYLHQI